MLNFENIPAELRALPHWVSAGPDKKPINPRTGNYADPSDTSTGASFNEAVKTGMKHIGFILSKDDPFAIVDLDNPFEIVEDQFNETGEKIKVKVIADEHHAKFPECVEIAKRHGKVMEAFNSYTELSQSGQGAHIVCRGSVPQGVRRDRIEVYSDQRYMIFTGNVIKAQGVTDCQNMLNQLYTEIGRMTTDKGELIEEDSIYENSEVWRMATNASNSEKFVSLCQGEMDGYPSQSEADLALLSMLCFYSRSNTQVKEMFRQTKLGEREKANKNDKYLNFCLKYIRSKEIPLVDTSQLASATPEPVLNKIEKPKAEIHLLSDKPGVLKKEKYTFPPGLVGEIAQYVLDSAIRPVPEIALAASLALCAGICGRSFNISGTGLNQYIILLAKTGRGKEGAASGIDNLMAAIRQTIPMADQFLGPANFASGQALIKTLDTKPCFVSVLGEFGFTLQQMCDANAPGPVVMLKRVLLDIYAKSGNNKVLRASVYSDSDKNTNIIQAPNVTLLGESTPDTFFSGLDSSHIAEGLIPRFSIIEYEGNRPKPNENAFMPPSELLISKVGQFITVCITAQQNNTACPVTIQPDAKQILDALNNEADNRINGTSLDVEAELWNRAHLKSLKLAALIAVGINPHAPAVNLDVAIWAVEFVKLEINSVMQRFKHGQIGTGELKQESEIRRLLEHFQTLTDEQKETHRCPQSLLNKAVSPYQFFAIYARRLACFKNDKKGPTRALKDVLDDMVKREVLEMIPLQQLQSEFKTRSAIYYAGPAW